MLSGETDAVMVHIIDHTGFLRMQEYLTRRTKQISAPWKFICAK